MKHLTLIFTMLLVAACGAQTPKEKQNNAQVGLKFDFTVVDAEGFDGWSDISLSLTRGDKECFNGDVGRVQYVDYAEEEFFPKCKNGAITAPDEILFFADIDFDGENELITDSSPFAGTQRDLPRFCSIYKLKNGKYMDATDVFTSRCDAFNMIEPYYFIVDYRDKSIVHYNDGGYMSGGWEVYKYNNGRYTYDRYVHFERDIEDEMVDITIDYPKKNTHKKLRMSFADFEKRDDIFRLNINSSEQ